MGRPKSNIVLGIPVASADGKFRTAYPHGNWPGIPGAASGAGVIFARANPAGAGAGAASATTAGVTRTTSGPTATASGGGGGSSGFTPATGFEVVSGALAEGQLFRVRRIAGGLGVKPNGAAAAWSRDFGHNGSDNSPRASVGSSADGTGATTSATRKAPNSTHALVTTHNDYKGGSAYKGITLSSPTGKMYALLKHNMGFDDSGTLGTNNWKFFRPECDPNGNHRPNIFCGIGTNGAGVHSGLAVENIAQGTMDGYDEFSSDSWWSCPATTNQWDTWECALKDSGQSTADGDLEVRKNGKVYRGLGTHLFRNRESGDDGVGYRTIHWIEKDNAFGTSDANRVWSDYQVVDDCWCRALLVDPILAAAGSPLAVEYQPLTDWSDGETIQIAPRLGSFSSRVGKELWVFDNTNTKYVFGVGN